MATGLLAGRLGLTKSTIASGATGNIVELDILGNEFGGTFQAYNASASSVDASKKVMIGVDAKGYAFFLPADSAAGGDPDPTLHYWWTMDWEKVDATFVPLVPPQSGTMNFDLGVRFRAEPDFTVMAPVEWTDNWTQTNHVLAFTPQNAFYLIEFTAFTIVLDAQYPGPYQYDCGSGNHIIYQTPVLSGTVDPGGGSEPDNT